MHLRPWRKWAITIIAIMFTFWTAFNVGAFASGEASMERDLNSTGIQSAAGLGLCVAAETTLTPRLRLTEILHLDMPGVSQSSLWCSHLSRKSLEGVRCISEQSSYTGFVSLDRLCELDSGNVDIAIG
jgi:hypothetical protein